MLSENITSLADVSFHIVAYMYARFRYSGKNPMRFAVFWRISLRFCGFRTPLTPPSARDAREASDVSCPTDHLTSRNRKPETVKLLVLLKAKAVHF